MKNHACLGAFSHSDKDTYDCDRCPPGLSPEYDRAVIAIQKGQKKWHLPLHLAFPNGEVFHLLSLDAARS